jgi:hypothetical protein
VWSVQSPLDAGKSGDTGNIQKDSCVYTIIVTGSQ